MKLPSVSCICITRNRRVFLQQSVAYFKRALIDYPSDDVEMVIVDSGDEQGWNFKMFPGYVHRPDLALEGGKARNLACDIAKNDIIIHWDDDDWQHPERITRQVTILLTSPGDALAFTRRFYWYHIGQRWAARSKTAEGGNTVGATFAYWKETWKKTPFREDVGMAEDISFQVDLRARGCPMLDALDPELLVYMRHNQNASLLTNYDRSDPDTEDCRKRLGSDVDFYDGIGELLPVLSGRESPWQP